MLTEPGTCPIRYAMLPRVSTHRTGAGSPSDPGQLGDGKLGAAGRLGVRDVSGVARRAWPNSSGRRCRI